MRKQPSRSLLLLLLSLTVSTAQADERLERLLRLDRIAEASAGGVTLARRELRPRVQRGWVIFSASARTRQTESAPIAAMGDAAAVVAATPHFARAEGDIFRGAAWTVELDAILRRPSAAGNAIFTFVDVSEPSGNGSQGYTAMFQATVPRSDMLVADVVLPLEEGFQPEHTYRMTVTQLVHGKSVVLAQGDLQLE